MQTLYALTLPYLHSVCVCACARTHVCAQACVKVWRRTGRLRFTLVFKLDGRSRVRTQREAKRKQSADYKRGLSRGAFNKDTESKYKYSSRHAPLKTGSAASRQPRSLCQRRGGGEVVWRKWSRELSDLHKVSQTSKGLV